MFAAKPGAIGADDRQHGRPAVWRRHGAPARESPGVPGIRDALSNRKARSIRGWASQVMAAKWSRPPRLCLTFEGRSRLGLEARRCGRRAAGRTSTSSPGETSRTRSPSTPGSGTTTQSTGAKPQRVGGHALRGRRPDLRPPRDVLRRSLPQDRRALREPAPGGAGGRRGAGTLARVPGPSRPRPPARAAGGCRTSRSRPERRAGSR